MSERIINIAIDGPAGSGKSTLAGGVARHYGFIYVDTGALYRTVGLYMQRADIDPKDAEAVAAALPMVDIKMRLENGRGVVTLDGVPVGEEIRTQKSSMYASDVSAIPAVREFLLETQRSIARENCTVMDGRDIGTVILPDAAVKLFVVADPEVRARRRFEELRVKKPDITFEAVLEDMGIRDKNDSGRKIAPAVPAADAVLLDNSALNAEETLQKAVELIDEILAK